MTDVQLEFEFDLLLAHAWPFLTTSEAALVLDSGERHILALLDAGILRGINIAVRIGETERRAIRIWRYSVLHHAIRPEAALGRPAVEEMMPLPRPYWLIREAARLFRCHSDTVSNLYTEGLLRGPDRSAARRGARHRNLRITQQSLIEFIENRDLELLESARIASTHRHQTQ